MNRFLTPGQCTTSDLTLIGPYLRILRSDSGSGCHSTRNACTNIFTDRIQHLAEGGNSDFALDVCHGSQIYLAARCGAPRERNGQFRALWCDPPRSPLCREWADFLCGWHRDRSPRRLLAARHYTSSAADDLGVLPTV
jgi:hypothetical protein